MQLNLEHYSPQGEFSVVLARDLLQELNLNADMEVAKKVCIFLEVLFAHKNFKEKGVELKE